MSEGLSWQAQRAAVRTARKPGPSTTSKRARKPRRNWASVPLTQKPRRLRAARTRPRLMTAPSGRATNWTVPRRLRLERKRANSVAAVLSTAQATPSDHVWLEGRSGMARRPRALTQHRCRSCLAVFATDGGLSTGEGHLAKAADKKKPGAVSAGRGFATPSPAAQPGGHRQVSGSGGLLPLLVNCPAWVIRPAGEARAEAASDQQRN